MMKLTAQNEEPIEWVSTHQLIKPPLTNPKERKENDV